MKNYQHKTELFNKLLNWRENDPKKYWDVLNTFKKADGASSTDEVKKFDCN